MFTFSSFLPPPPVTFPFRLPLALHSPLRFCCLVLSRQERNALFPGKSCFPLSAEKPSSYSDGLDQLNVIFDVIGTPSREDIAGLVRAGGSLEFV